MNYNSMVVLTRKLPIRVVIHKCFIRLTRDALFQEKSYYSSLIGPKASRDPQWPIRLLYFKRRALVLTDWSKTIM